ncbi:hypothetical protein [Levilactobacillus yonginensis]|uniref:hypothetical protein n=1 Tax=Levilactobacillus yonginensis TaxID=1054041 RepID=UPI00345D9AC5
MMKKISHLMIGVAALFVGLGLALAVTSTASAEKTNIPGPYSRSTPVKARGTWYGKLPYIHYRKLIVKKHSVTWYEKDKRAGAWKKTRHLKNGHLFVRHDKIRLHKKTRAIFGFYSANQDDADFNYLSTKRVKGKKVHVMISPNGGTYYHSWKNVK